MYVSFKYFPVSNASLADYASNWCPRRGKFLGKFLNIFNFFSWNSKRNWHIRGSKGANRMVTLCFSLSSHQFDIYRKKKWQFDFYFVVSSQFLECRKRSKSLMYLIPGFNLCLKTKEWFIILMNSTLPSSSFLVFFWQFVKIWSLSFVSAEP